MLAVMSDPELRNAEQPLRVFVSSVIAGLTQERRAARAAAEALGMDPWVFEETPASSEGLQDSYLMYVTDADFVLWLVGEHTTEPVEREVRLAAASPRPRLLAFVFRDREQDEATTALLTELGASMKWLETTAETLEDAVRKTLEDELRRAARARVAIAGEPVPAPLAGFVAREDELALVESWVAAADVRPLTVGISGMPGVGKTALALELADRLREQYPDVALYEDLRGARAEPVSMAHALALMLPALGLSAEHPEPQAAYQRAMGTRRGLLILDDARDEAAGARPHPCGVAERRANHRADASRGTT